MNGLLQPGDVLVFKVEEKWLSKLIAWLTDSDVSHAAMLYSENTMVEMGLDGIMISPIETGHGEAAYQLRLSSPMDPQPLLDAARVYIEDKVCYDLPALTLLGILLVYRHIRPNTPSYHFIDALLNLACLAVDDLLNRLLHHPGAMVCSQLVYQIYQDCGNAYAMQVHGGTLQLDFASMDGLIRLVDFAIVPKPGEETILSPAPDNNTNVESLAKQLLCALQQPQGKVIAATPPESVCHTVGKFDKKLRQLAKTAGIPMEALFVTPGDIAHHTDNLQTVSNIQVERLSQA